MKFRKIAKRLLLLPLGLLKGLSSMTNVNARDYDNKLRFKPVSIGPNCSFTESTTIGDYSSIYENCIINHCKIGSYTYIAKNALIQNATIGNYCSISTDVKIGLGTHPLNLFSTSPIFYKVRHAINLSLVEKDLDFDEYSPIQIGSDVWIGANVTIMDGLSIGHGSVIATGAIVTKDVPPYAIVGGIPAKILKYRFAPEVIEDLLQTRWWQKNAKEVYEMRDELNSKSKSYG